MSNFYQQGYYEILIKLGAPPAGMDPAGGGWYTPSTPVTNPARMLPPRGGSTASAAGRFGRFGRFGKFMGRFGLPLAALGLGAAAGSRLFSDPKPPQQQYYSNVM